MPFTFEHVVPWGRSLEEYRRMFALSQADLQKQILGCGDGPASFNYELNRRGGHVISIDPIYQFTGEEIRSRIEATRNIIIQEAKKNHHEFVWDMIPSVEALEKMRIRAMTHFLSDFPIGLAEGRYVPASLPHLPFHSEQFDLALSSHFLFLYSEHFSYDLHLRSIQEMARVATEIRIFPLLELGSLKSRYLDRIISDLTRYGFECEIQKVDYEFQKGGNELLRIVNVQ